MGFEPRAVDVPPGVESLLRSLVREHTGIFFDETRGDVLVDKLTPLVLELGFDSLLDYYYLLKYDDPGGVEWRRLADALSVGETYFWRGIEQIRALVDVILPERLAARSGRPLRVWSAACSTGEEPLTIAMALAEAGLLDARVEIRASDASQAAIERARRGLYRERSFRALDPDLRSKYFVPERDAWRVRPELHERVSWSRANLVDEAEAGPLAEADVIFCRNVFIYFSEDAIRRTLRLFSDRMSDPGYLFVAASESLLRLTADFEFQEIGDAFAYVKRPRGAARS
jgi:chemotaxis protein methyltransferase CheR